MTYDPENPDVVTVMRAVIAERRDSRRTWRAFMLASIVAAAVSLVAIYGWAMYFVAEGR